MSNHETNPAPTVRDFGLNGYAVVQDGQVISPQFRSEAAAGEWLADRVAPDPEPVYLSLEELEYVHEVLCDVKNAATRSGAVYDRHAMNASIRTRLETAAGALPALPAKGGAK